MATHSSILACRIPWTKESEGYSPVVTKSRTRLKWLSMHAWFHHGTLKMAPNSSSHWEVNSWIRGSLSDFFGQQNTVQVRLFVGQEWRSCLFLPPITWVRSPRGEVWCLWNLHAVRQPKLAMWRDLEQRCSAGPQPFQPCWLTPQTGQGKLETSWVQLNYQLFPWEFLSENSQLSPINPRNPERRHCCPNFYILRSFVI